jgi:hypothetical protein
MLRKHLGRYIKRKSKPEKKKTLDDAYFEQ